MKKALLTVWILITIITSFNYEVYALADIDKTNEKSSLKAHESKEDESGDVFYFQIDKTFSSILQVDFHADFSFEFELPIILDNTHYTRTHDQKEEKEYFKTLFHFIISPNAP